MSEPNHHKFDSKQDYQTPPELLAAIKQRLGIEEFTIDLAASAENAIAKLYYTAEHSALGVEMPWTIDKKGWAFCNPPYGNILPWVTKAAMESREGAQVAMLLPASVGANWWRDWVDRIAHVWILNGRVQFVGADQASPKDHAVLLYSPIVTGGYEVWSWKEEK